VLASVDAGTEVATTIDRAEAGVAVPPEDPDAFCSALDELLADPARRAAMGAAGRRFVEGWVSPAAVGVAYEALFDEVVARRRHGRGAG
jgi:colanic acid biosynthesis glycosyl transferase WcaI